MYRIGIGHDTHRLTAGRRLVLGGVEIESERGAEGHSDADALAHAVADAILGALCEGDLGVHFPDRDPQWKDADSLDLLARVAWLARRQSGRDGDAGKAAPQAVRPGDARAAGADLGRRALMRQREGEDRRG